MKDYILIKLRSGEEIIASLMSKNRNGVKVLRPMQIRQVPFMDHRTGSLKAAVVFENWIGRTDDNEVVIPNNWIGIKMLPSHEVIEAYEKYMQREDAPVETPKKEEPLFSKAEEEEMQKLEDEMTRMLKETIFESGVNPLSTDKTDNFSNTNTKNDGKDTVIVNFVFPANIFKNMMEEGLMDDFLMGGMPVDDNGDDSADDLEDDVDEKPNKKKRIRENNIDFKEKGDESWGNSFRDWSPNPNDYL